MENNETGCGCMIIILIILIPLTLKLIVSSAYIEKNKAPKSCMFAQDTITCVQVAKQKKEIRGKNEI